MPLRLQQLPNSPLNSAPLSHLTAAGTPYLHTMFSWNQSLTLALDRSFNRPSSTHLQNTQMATITSLAPLGLAGLILTMLSSAHIKKGYSPFSQGSRNGGLGNLALSNCLGLLLVLRHMQSLRIPIQKYLGLSASYSWCPWGNPRALSV